MQLRSIIFISPQCSPRDASALHVVGQGDVIGPDVELPLSQAEHAAQHGARVDADPHVQIHLCVGREEENKGTHATLGTKGAQHTLVGRPKLLFTRRAIYEREARTIYDGTDSGIAKHANHQEKTFEKRIQQHRIFNKW